MTTPEILAQLEDYKPLLNYGLAGVFMAWLMWRVDGRLMSIEKAINHNSHKMTGITRAMLIELVGRETTSVAAKAAAREELARFSPPPQESTD